MIRSTYRNIMLGALCVSIGASFFMFRKAQDFQQQIMDKENEIIRLRQERENAESLHIAYVELDGLTITEQTATQLDILRHLGLEQSDLTFQMENRDVQAIGSTSLYIHTVRISGKLLYSEALALVDRLQNTKKIVLDAIELLAPSNNDGDKVGFALEGKIYGLDKVLTPSPLTPAEVPPAEPVTDPSATFGVTETVSLTDISGTLPAAEPVSGTFMVPAAVSPATPEPLQTTPASAEPTQGTGQ
jgi:hypothetical protein